jgi:hypothetical protein
MTWTTGFVASIVMGMSSKGSLFGKESLLGQRRDLDFSCRPLVFEERSPGPVSLPVYLMLYAICCVEEGEKSSGRVVYRSDEGRGVPPSSCSFILGHGSLGWREIGLLPCQSADQSFLPCSISTHSSF